MEGAAGEGLLGLWLFGESGGLRRGSDRCGVSLKKLDIVD